MVPRLVTLSDGRHVSLVEYGTPHGQPLVYCHGFPGSRLEAGFAAAAASRLEVRIVSIDRPGYGYSSPQPGRTLLDWPADLAAVLDELDIGDCPVIGVSGGAPYALAAARTLKHRIGSVLLICGLGPLAGHGGLARMPALQRTALKLAGRAPRMTDLLVRQAARRLIRRCPEGYLRLMSGGLAQADSELIADRTVTSIFAEAVREAFHGDGSGPARDLCLYARDWGFSLAEVAIPVYLWHGEADRIVPVEFGRAIAAALPRVVPRFLAGEGHFSLPVHHIERMLGSLLQAGNPDHRPPAPGRGSELNGRASTVGTIERPSLSGSKSTPR
jgi:pimeloyl-ACP methyl ester carboxylesterase